MAEPTPPTPDDAAPTHPAAEPTATTGATPIAQPPASRALRRAGWATLAAVLAGLVAVVSLPFTNVGTRGLFALAPVALPGLQIDAPRGALLGDFQADRLTWRLSPTQTLVIEQLTWQGLRWSHDRVPGDGLAGGWTLHLARLHAHRLMVQGASANTGPTTLPTQLVLPIGVQVDAMAVDQLGTDALADRPVQDLRAAVHLGRGPLAEHRINGLTLRWDRLQARGDARVQAAAPLTLAAALRLTPFTQPGVTVPDTPALAQDWQAQIEANGPLRELMLKAQVRARDQQLDATATLALADAMPLRQLNASAKALDLSALHSGWPRTALSGQIQAQVGTPATAGGTAALNLQADLRNSRAGRLDDHLLPLRRLQAQAHSTLAAPGTGQIERITLELGSSDTAAGRISATGRWASDGPSGALSLQAQAQLDDLVLDALDRRAPALRLSGPLTADWRASHLDLRGQLSGSMRKSANAAPLPLSLALDLGVDADGLDGAASSLALQLRQLDARSGESRLSAQGRVQQRGQAWTVQLDATLQAFDPGAWLPVAALPGGSAAWQHRLDGPLHADLSLPAPPAGSQAQAFDRLAQLRGQASLDLRPPSVLAGVPATGRVDLRQDGGQLHALVTLRAAGNARNAGNTPTTSKTTSSPGADVSLEGRLDPQGRADAWTLRAQIPALESLAPWWRLIDPGLTLTGDAQLDLQAKGRWPRLTTQGSLRMAQGRWRLTPPPPAAALLAKTAANTTAGKGSSATATATTATATTATPAAATPTTSTPAEFGQLKDLDARWQLGSQPDDPLLIDLRLAGGQVDRWRIDPSTLHVQGSGGAHQLQAQLAGARLPATGSSNGGEPPSPPRRWQALLQAQGGWFHEAATPAQPRRGMSSAVAASPGRLGWQGKLNQLTLREPGSASATASATATTPVWLNLAPTALRWQQVGSGAEARQELHVDATRLSLADAVLALDASQWQQRAGQPPRFSLRGRLEPLVLAPLLARTQPEFGWRGDLRIGGELDLQATADRFSAHIALARTGGDLVVADPDNLSGPQSLGLTQLQLDLRAVDGQWRFTQQIAGANLGSLAGEQTVRTRANVLWPEPGAALSGQLSLQIAQLAHWGRWLPPGWRLAGQLQSQARLAGSFGAPTFSGELSGQQISVRNLLQGVDWRDASLRVALDGETARIEQLQVRAGAGTLSATGRAQFNTLSGSTPKLELQARADHFAVLQRVDRRVVVSGTADLALDAKATRLTAAIVADEGRIDFSQGDAPGLASDVQVLRAGDDVEAARASAAAKGTRAIVLDVRADLGPAFMLRGRGLNTRLAGDLRLTSPANKPQLNGTLRAVDGTYAAYGQKLVISRGLISFAGAPENPRLDVQALRNDLQNDDVKVGVAITGTAQSPRVRLFSDPEMSDTDKLSWLLMGRPSDALGRTDLGLLQRAAYALLSGESDSPSIIQRLGLDSLSVSQSDGTVRETVVSLGKQLSRRWYVGYERSLEATTGSWQLIYRIAQRFTVRAQSGQDNALDFIWTWKWGEAPP